VSSPHGQRGAALIVSLIMLLLISILAVTAFRLGKSNLQIVGNIQQRSQAIGAAQTAIDQVISNIQFTQTPDDAVPATVANPCNGTPNTLCTSASGGTGTDIKVTLRLGCDSIQPIATTKLNWNSALDRGCLKSKPNSSHGQVGGSNNDSQCANSVWNVHASANDTITQAAATVDEGVGVRVPVVTTCN